MMHLTKLFHIHFPPLIRYYKMLSFLSCDPESDLTTLLSNQFDGCLLGDSSLQGIETSGINSVAVTERSIGVVPVGGLGGLLWKRLPPELAIRAVSPLKTSMFVIPENVISHSDSGPLWKFLVENAHSLKVLTKTDAEPPITNEFPQLVPRKRIIAKWLKMDADAYTPDSIDSQPDAIALRAGLFQLYDELDRSHDYSQECQGRGQHVAGDYWHAIMHRREPDVGNSKYWFRRVGDHPVFKELAEIAVSVLAKVDSPAADKWTRKLTDGGWDPFVFVDLCEQCVRGVEPELTAAAQEIQWVEMILLMEQTWKDATGAV